MKRLQKLNEYRTPEEWKARAEKIADGKGIYASVKRTSAVKWAAAAAVAAVIGFEGYSLLSTSVRQTETDPTLLRRSRRKTTILTTSQSRR